MDLDTSGNMVVGGVSKDDSLVISGSRTVPIVVYITNDPTVKWAK